MIEKQNVKGYNGPVKLDRKMKKDREPDKIKKERKAGLR